MQIENQSLDLEILRHKNIALSIKREDLIHPLVSGNKFRKLKYNLLEATNKNYKRLLTFGGAYSNHIAATAYAGKKSGFKTIGVIRGEELAKNWQKNPTLKLAYEHGMQFKFISREAYKKKNAKEFISEELPEFKDCYFLPEGGTNLLAVKGCEEIITNADADFDVLCASVGTGGTLAGISNAAFQGQSVLGFTALKGEFLKEDIRNFATKENWSLQTDYHFGGYAKVNEELVDFINNFKKETKIPLDPIYNGKMIFGILDLVAKDYFKPGTNILAIHTGGLQGIAGMNLVLKKKNVSPII